MDRVAGQAEQGPSVLFVCLHGSAKSLIAAEQFNRIARQRGLALRAESAGLEPDTEVPENVVRGLDRDGMQVRGYAPRYADRRRLDAASVVVTFGSVLPDTRSGVRVEQWNDTPIVSDGFDRARDAIIARVEQLIASLC